jgi:ribosome-binding factor A
MPKSYRKERLDELFWEEINSIVMYELSDPRVSDIGVTLVDVAPDLTTARVFITPFYEDVDTRKVLKGLDAAQGYIRTQLAQRIKVRRIPELIFKIDHSYLQARRVDAILDSLPPVSETSDTPTQEETASD